MAKAPNTAGASDTVEAEVVSQPNPNPTPLSTPAPSPIADEREAPLVEAAEGIGESVMRGVTSPETAMVALKTRVSLLHALANNAGHYSTLALDDVETALSDLRWLASYIRSKV